MPHSVEGLTAEAAGALLGVSGARVRQIMRSGQLRGTEGADGRLWFDADEVRRLARDRNTGKVRVARGSGFPPAGNDLESVMTRVITATLPKAIEAATTELRKELDRERAARIKAERELARLRRGANNQ